MGPQVTTGTHTDRLQMHCGKPAWSEKEIPSLAVPDAHRPSQTTSFRRKRGNRTAVRGQIDPILAHITSLLPSNLHSECPCTKRETSLWNRTTAPECICALRYMSVSSSPLQPRCQSHSSRPVDRPGGSPPPRGQIEDLDHSPSTEIPLQAKNSGRETVTHPAALYVAPAELHWWSVRWTVVLRDIETHTMKEYGRHIL
nr:hypothetical protein CFP56_52416 [Quercus suber]